MKESKYTHEDLTKAIKANNKMIQDKYKGFERGYDGAKTMNWNTVREKMAEIKEEPLKKPDQILTLMEEKCLPDSMTRTDKDLEFRNELQHLLNRYGMDNLCNMRDFVLAEYINKTLYNLAQASAIEDFMRNG